VVFGSQRLLDANRDLQYHALALAEESYARALRGGRGLVRLRRLLQVAAVSAALVSPLGAFAATQGSVTTSPLGAAAPALVMPMLIALAMALIGLGAYRLYSRSAGTAAMLALVAGLGLLAGLAYADGTVMVQDTNCNMETTQPYLSSAVQTLVSLCPNPIRIVAIDPGCGMPDPPVSHCTVGQILSNGQNCILPSCL